MKCRECGFDNAGNAKYCSRCGFHLAQLGDKKIYCTNCGYENSAASEYCTDCGKGLFHSGDKPDLQIKSKKVNSVKKIKQHTPVASKSHKSSFAFNLTIFVVIILGILIAISMNKKSNSSRGVESTFSSVGDTFLEAQVLTVAEKFRCTCGTCGGTPLEECSCESAIGEKQFIREKLKTGQEVEQVIAMVNQTYGWLKPEFSDKYGGSEQ